MKTIKDQKEKEDISKSISDGIEQIKKNVKEELIEPFKNDFKEIINNNKKICNEIKNLFNDNQIDVNHTKLDIIRLKDLLEEPKKKIHKVPKANGIGAYKVLEDNVFKIFMCFLCDDEIIDEKENFHFIVSGNELSLDVENIFENNDLVILK